MRSIDFTPEQASRRTVAAIKIHQILTESLDTPEHRMLLLGCLLDTLIGEVTDPAAVPALLRTLIDTHRACMARLAVPEGRA